MKLFFKILIFFAILNPDGLMAQERASVGVGRFVVNGPPASQYLGSAAQDAVVGSLMQQGVPAHALDKALDPEKLDSPKKIKKPDGLWVGGRIHVVGQTYRVLLKWIDTQGRSGEDYLQINHPDQLLPQLESYAVDHLKAPPLARIQEKKKTEAPTVFAKEAPSPPVTPQASTARPAPAKGLAPQKKDPAVKLREYDFISERIPLEIRGLAFGDVDGDGRNEVLLTSQDKLQIHSFEQGKLGLLAEYPGGRMDYFVKVDLLPLAQSKAPLIILTNLRGAQAKGKILRYSQGRLTAIAEDVPFRMRVVRDQGTYQLIGSTYSATSDRARHNIFRLALEGSEVRPVEKLPLPGDTDLYNYQWIPPTEKYGRGVVTMSPSGKLRFFEQRDQKFKKAWESHDSYGGSGNYVPVQVKNIFNEVVSDYYSVPVGLGTVQTRQGTEVVVVKNHSLVKNVIGRVPVISDGQITRLTMDELGFVETWVSKKVDGSIQDYLVTESNGTKQLMVAVRLRDPGLFGDVGRKDSVLLLYNIH